MELTIKSEQESDGRWLAEVKELPGAMTYGRTRLEAISRAQALALRVLADQVENQETQTESLTVPFNAA